MPAVSVPWAMSDDNPLEPEPFALEITDVIDLHTFAPRDVPNVVRDFLDAAVERGFLHLRIIHGRGTGTQRQTVRTLLERDPRVLSFADAPGGAGGWGATCVELVGADPQIGDD